MDYKELQKYDYAEDSLSILDKCNILTKEDFAKLVEMRDELEHGFERGQVFRTEYEARHSVLVDAKFPNADSKYWQAVREQSVHFSELVSLSFEYRKLAVKLARTEVKKARLQSELEKLEADQFCSGLEHELQKTDLRLRIKELEIKEGEMSWHMKNQERTADARMREIEQWCRIKEELLPELEFGTEDCGAHQHKSYLQRFYRQAELIKQGRANLSGPEAINLLSQLENAIRVPENRETVGELYGENIKDQLDNTKKETKQLKDKEE